MECVYTLYFIYLSHLWVWSGDDFFEMNFSFSSHLYVSLLLLYTQVKINSYNLVGIHFRSPALVSPRMINIGQTQTDCAKHSIRTDSRTDDRHRVVMNLKKDHTYCRDVQLHKNKLAQILKLKIYLLKYKIINQIWKCIFILVSVGNYFYPFFAKLIHNLLLVMISLQSPCPPFSILFYKSGILCGYARGYWHFAC
jgi:hypothetical protein